MKIAVIAVAYPQWSETFVRREVMALAARGHEVRVFAGNRSTGPVVGRPNDVPVDSWRIEHLRRFAPDVLYGQLGFVAHRKTWEFARELNCPFAVRLWQGHDTFVAPSPEFYATISATPLCRAVIVEDEWMRSYAAAHMAVQSDRLRVVPNSIDCEQFKPTELTPLKRPPYVILAVARFVDKKGLGPLVTAFRAIDRTDAELWLVGDGPDRHALLDLARGDQRIRFVGILPEEELPDYYHRADIFAAPCVRGLFGDADGIPTTALEAMACGLPVIVSDLYSAPYYVRDGETGICVPPGSVEELRAALVELLADHELRARLGAAARAWALRHLDIRRNVYELEAALAQRKESLEVRWRAGLDAIAQHRRNYTSERLAYYAAKGCEALMFFELPHVGALLDVGCGDGSMRALLPHGLQYHGVDAVAPAVDGFNFRLGNAEDLPFPDEIFDVVLSYSVLQHVIDPRRALREMLRVLRRGGRLALQACINDPNPIFLHQWTQAGLAELLREVLGDGLEATHVIDRRLFLARGVRLCA